MKVLKSMMKERMADPERRCEDFFDHVIQELRREKPLLTETIALDLMFVLLFASFETTALALTLGVKLLAENPKVVDALRVSNKKKRQPGEIIERAALLTEQANFAMRDRAGGARHDRQEQEGPGRPGHVGRVQIHDLHEPGEPSPGPLRP